MLSKISAESIVLPSSARDEATLVFVFTDDDRPDITLRCFLNAWDIGQEQIQGSADGNPRQAGTMAG